VVCVCVVYMRVLVFSVTFLQHPEKKKNNKD